MLNTLRLFGCGLLVKPETSNKKSDRACAIAAANTWNRLPGKSERLLPLYSSRVFWKTHRYLTEEALPGIWLSFADQTDWRSLEKDPSLWTISKWLLKQFSDVAVPVLLLSLFQMLTLSLKKCCLKSSRGLLLLSLREWHCVRLRVKYSKKVGPLKLTDDNPWIILNTSLRSALIRLSSNNHKLSFGNLVSYERCLTDGIILVKFFCIFFRPVWHLSCSTETELQHSTPLGVWPESYSRCNMSVCLHLIVRFIGPNIFEALLYACWHCWGTFKSLDMIIPKFRSWVTSSNFWPCMKYCLQRSEFPTCITYTYQHWTTSAILQPI